MTASKHDAHARPPENLRLLFKQCQKCSIDDYATTNNDGVVDTAALDGHEPVREVSICSDFSPEIEETFQQFTTSNPASTSSVPLRCFEIKSLPGLLLYPSLFPQSVQVELLDKLLHRDLSNPAHKTNLHLHYDLSNLPPFESANSVQGASRPSFFELDPTTTLQPKNSTVHKPITMQQALDKKLRWVTLGGQYDWTAKVYPDGVPPQFPGDVADLLHAVFPNVDPQAAILNFYSPGDTLSLHRDVSEECDRGLISVSIGCDALFLVANTDGTEAVTIRLRSGDAVLMSDQSRYAWHAIPKVLADTCPESLKDWPAQRHDSAYSHWKGWLSNKRINLNVRQMRTQPYEYKLDTT